MNAQGGGRAWGPTPGSPIAEQSQAGWPGDLCKWTQPQTCCALTFEDKDSELS